MCYPHSEIMSSPPQSSIGIFSRGLRIDERSNDPYQVSKHAPYWEIVQDLLRPGPFCGRVKVVHTESIQLILFERSNSTRVSASGPKNCFLVSFSIDSNDQTFYQGSQMRIGQIAITDPAECIESLHLGSSQIITIAIHETLAQSIAHAHGYDSFRSFVPREHLLIQSVNHLNLMKQAITEHLADHLERRTPESSNAVTASLACDIIESIFSASVHGPVAGCSRKHARVAEEYLMHHPHEPLDLIRICEQVGISARCLQISFLKSFGISMKAYTHALRFNGVRRDLIAACPAEQSVKAIARHWGFCHMGRFSINYRRWFGECPIQTLRRPHGVEIV